MRSAEIVHVDLDAFYASVERRRRPELAGAPLVVGGRGARGVVLSCSYEARASGVRNGMPGMRARRLCPGAVFVEPDFRAYRDASKAFRAVLESFSPVVEPLSLDEAFCDVSGAHALFGPTESIAARIRARVRDELGITCSVGGGPSKLVAKLASRACKPDGMLVVTDLEAFLSPMEVGELWGVGEATADTLRRVGLRTAGDIARTPRRVLQQAIGEQAGAALHDVANGVDDRPVTPDLDAKSVGAEETFESDLVSDDRIGAEILRLSDRVASRLVASGVTGRTVTLKIRLAGFETFTRSATLRTPTSDVWTIHRVASECYARFGRGRRHVRLVGVSVSGLTREGRAEQLSFERRPSYAEAEQAMARIRERFGHDAVGLARLLEPSGDGER